MPLAAGLELGGDHVVAGVVELEPLAENMIVHRLNAQGFLLAAQAQP